VIPRRSGTSYQKTAKNRRRINAINGCLPMQMGLNDGTTSRGARSSNRLHPPIVFTVLLNFTLTMAWALQSLNNPVQWWDLYWEFSASFPAVAEEFVASWKPPFQPIQDEFQERLQTFLLGAAPKQLFPLPQLLRDHRESRQRHASLILNMNDCHVLFAEKKLAEVNFWKVKF